MILFSVPQSQEPHQFALLVWVEPLKELLGQLMNSCIILHEVGVTGVAFGSFFFKEIEIFGEFEPMVYFDPEFDLPEVGVGDDYLSQDAGLDHSDECFHF